MYLQSSLQLLITKSRDTMGNFFWQIKDRLVFARKSTGYTFVTLMVFLMIENAFTNNVSCIVCICYCCFSYLQYLNEDKQTK